MRLYGSPCHVRPYSQLRVDEPPAASIPKSHFRGFSKVFRFGTPSTDQTSRLSYRPFAKDELKSLAPSEEREDGQTIPPLITPAHHDPPLQPPLASKPTTTPSRRTIVQIDLPKVNIESAVETMKIARTLGLPTEDVVLESSPESANKESPPARFVRNKFIDKKMKADYVAGQQREEAQASLLLRGELPLMKKDNQTSLLDLVHDNDVAIILAETGSGKTTQIPQILLDDMLSTGQGSVASVVCTQPRRIAATSVAQRVEEERKHMDMNHRSVGHHIRNDRSNPRIRGSITYCTTGILLNRLIANATATLSSHSHIIIDEVHERDIQIDLVLSLIRSAIRARKAVGYPYPKVLLMSASIDPSTFLEYFREPDINGTVLQTACMSVEGRRVQVDSHFLPEILLDMSEEGGLPEPIQHYLQRPGHQSSRAFIDSEMQFAKTAQIPADATENHTSDTPSQEAPLGEPETPDPGTMVQAGLAASVIAHIALNKPPGDILAFFPGGSDMENVEDILLGEKLTDMGLNVKDETRFKLFKLHSLRRETNNEVFDPVPQGCRRIILATNIAETSITLPEVVYVIDTGRERNKFFDSSTLARSLPFQWISKTNSIQRRGRAGRVSHGHYYALFTKERHDSFRSMNRPAIGESDLAEVALQFKAFPQHVDVEAFLLETINPPSMQAITNAVRQLQSLGALTQNGEITSLGRLLHQLGVYSSAGKAILLGALFGCLEPMLIIACHDAGSPLISSLDVSLEKLRLSKQQYLPDSETDFAWIVEAFKEYHAAYVARDEQLMENLRLVKNIRHQTYLEMMTTAQGLQEVLVRNGFVPPPEAGKTIFESLPVGLNANSQNMGLIKALLINCITAELAVWTGKPNWNWAIDSPALNGISSKQGFQEAKAISYQNSKKVFRSRGRLKAYTWKQEAPSEPGDDVFLDQASMVTPLMAILFAQSVSRPTGRILELNSWLRLDLSLPAEVPRAVSVQAATVLIEVRKTIHRFINLGWLELEQLNRPQKKKSSVSRNNVETPPVRTLGPELRKAMVESVVSMLEADHDHWESYRKERRAKIALELAAERERLKKAKAEKAALSKETGEEEGEEDGEKHEEKDEEIRKEAFGPVGGSIFETLIEQSMRNAPNSA